MLLACWLTGCGEKPAAPGPAAVAIETNRPISGSPDVQFYLVRGVVKKIEAGEKSITIQHESIPKYMAAMTMPFKVKDAKELEGLQVGDTVWFRLWVAPDESWVDKLKKEQNAQTNQPQASAPPEREAFRVARDVEPLNVGDPMPDYHFTNELGRAVSLSEFRGQALAFTFIFTRCPLPDFCPRMSRNFQEVYQKLTARADAPTNWHLLSISFDPHFDTPAVLRGYGDTRTPTLVWAGVLLVNIALVPFLVRLLGIQGAGVSTGIAMGCGVLAYAVLLSSGAAVRVAESPQEQEPAED